MISNRYNKRVLSAVVAAAALVIGLAAPNAQAQVTVPPGLLPGATYHLAFMTCGGRDAQSTNIADYDVFVTGEANLVPALTALGTTWKVIGSTSTVDAITHIGVAAPVYNLAGQLMATGSADLFDGSISNPVGYTQGGGGDCGLGAPFTGTYSSGLKKIGSELGTPASCGNCVGIGVLAATDGLWIGHPATRVSALILPFYAISGVLTVPEPTATRPGTWGHIKTIYR